MMKFRSLNGDEDGEHSDVSIVELSEIFATHDAIFFEIDLFDGV